MQDQNKKDTSIVAQVTEALPNTFFRVRREDNGEEMLTYLSGKMRLHRIRVLIGDKVIVEIDPYGGKGRIVKRV
ncbi:MAG: translation initiation factor IF-1 [Parcubacteria group bacterium]